jgi:hypothetical protein
MIFQLRNVLKSTVRLVVPLILISAAFAQYDPCHIPGGYYRTQTQGGWGAPCHGGNAGCILQNNFATVYPSGLTIGGGYTAHFSSAAAVIAFLPSTATPSVLTANLNNPTSTPAGVFAGQVLALEINVDFSNAGVTGFNPNLGNLIVPTGIYSPSGAFAGWTVNQILAVANLVLGGHTASLPAGISISDLNGVVDGINNSFDNGTCSTGYLVDPNCDQQLPVEISSFSANSTPNGVSVSWRTASERDITYYGLERRADSGSWESLAQIVSHGNSASGSSYSYVDGSVQPGTFYSYRLMIHDVNGDATVYGQMATATPVNAVSPADYVLSQNYPNPFNPSTMISFNLKEAGRVRLSVFDVLGREVAVLVNGDRAAGSYDVNFNAGNLPTGVYLYRLEAGSFSAVRKLVLLK